MILSNSIHNVSISLGDFGLSSIPIHVFEKVLWDIMVCNLIVARREKTVK